MANYYCKYCGYKAARVSALTLANCSYHPDGALKGKHVLYEVSEKSKYTCKFCGTQAATISGLVLYQCSRHPNGTVKGKHEVAL